MRFVVFGEALIDLIPTQERTPAESTWVAHSGGSPMNTAVALGKLGCEVQFLGRLGDDAFGRQLASHIESFGVGLDLAVRTTDPTTLAVVSLDEDGKASYAFHTDGTTNFHWAESEFPEVPADAWLHFGSIGAVLEPTYASVHRFLSSTPNPKSFDINVRPKVLSDREEYRTKVDALLALVAQSGGFGKASDEDLVWLTDSSLEPLDAASEFCRRHGLDLFLVTLGSRGAAAVGPDGIIASVPGRRIEVVDTVGAGDTFTAGFLSAFDGTNVEESLRRGIGASALVCTRAGAQPPTAAELDAFLAS